MKTRYIGKGDCIDTPYGYIKITSRNDGGLIYADEWEINGDGCDIYTGEGRYTLEEISNILSAVSHRDRIKAVWDNYREEE